MKKVLIATNNKGKAKDFEVLFEPYGIQVMTLNDLEQDIDVEETGTTFEENAVLKAEEVAKQLGIMVISDDSGLEIDALNGAPGVYSARYAGPAKNDDANIDKVLEELQEVPEDERTARFRCVLAIAGPQQETKTFSGSCEGFILNERRGTNGFGYDPIFYTPAKQRAMAELTPAEKGEISHRGAALAQLKEQLPTLMASFGEEQ